MSKNKRKRLVNPHGCNTGENVSTFEVTRSEYMNEDGELISLVCMTCEGCQESAEGETLKAAIKDWNAEHPLISTKAGTP